MSVFVGRCRRWRIVCRIIRRQYLIIRFGRRNWEKWGLGRWWRNICESAVDLWEGGREVSFAGARR